MFYAYEEHVLNEVSTSMNESTSKFEHSHLLKRFDNRQLCNEVIIVGKVVFFHSIAISVVVV